MDYLMKKYIGWNKKENMKKEIHSVYHIFPKGEYSGKVGATENVGYRVELQQGASKDEYEILLETEDMMEASKAEIHFQNLHGYPNDPLTYYEIKTQTKMKNGITFVLSKGKDWYSNYQTNRHDALRFAKEEGLEINGNHYDYSFFRGKLESIIQDSMYSGCYMSARAVNKLIATPIATPTETIKSYMEVDPSRSHETMPLNTFDKIAVWARGLGITNNTIQKQTLKLGEEYGELSKAVLDGNDLEIRDALGDMVVVMVSVAAINGTTLEQCIEDVYTEIQSRVPVKDAEGNVVATKHTGDRKKNT